MTDLPRYRALSRSIRALRDGPARIHIDGPEPLTTSIDDVTMEGAATSLQVHLRVTPQDFAGTYNAAQAATALALAASSNSPLFLGHRLWAETRIALFKQAVDSRPRAHDGIRMPSRVSFGHGWVRDGAHELFAENVALFPALIPCLSQDSPRKQLNAGAIPELSELRLHAGTVWRWNRAVFDPADGGHLRIELRALPAGPTPLDCVANAAYLVGLTLGLQRDLAQLLPSFPFPYAQDNFYRAAEGGLQAQLTWPTGTRAPVLARVPAAALVEQLMPTARDGLLHAGVEASEVAQLLEVIARRVASQRTGAHWQLQMLAQLEPELGREQALSELTQRYVELSKSGMPVDRWSLP